MKNERQHSSPACLAAFAVCAAALVMAFSSPAMALDIDVCAPGFPAWSFTSKVVFCVESAVVSAVVVMLNALSSYMAKTVAAMMCFAIIIFGFRILGGEKELTKKAISFILRLAIVLVFSYNMGGLAGAIFAIEQDMLSWVTGGWSPWIQIDMILGWLFGFGSTLTLVNGIIALVGAALTSGSLGFWLFMMGLGTVIQILIFVFRLVYTYLSALLFIGYVLLLSSMIVPLGAFNYTERYVKKWLDTLMSAMLMPILLFATLWMFLGIFGILVSNVFLILGCPNVTAGCKLESFVKQDTPLFSSMRSYDANWGKLLSGVTGNTGIVEPVQLFVNPMVQNTFNSSGMNAYTLDFGPASTAVMQQLVFSFLTLIIFVYILTTFVNHVPAMAADIVGGASGVAGMEIQKLPFEKEIGNALRGRGGDDGKDKGDSGLGLAVRNMMQGRGR